MIDLEQVRDNDIENGKFDIYTDDIDFTEEQYVELRMKDKVRISDINPYDIDNPEIFEHIKKVTDYIKRVADAVCPNGYKVFDNKIMSYVKVILAEVNKDMKCLERVSDELFRENYLLEGILYRDLVVQSNQIKSEQDDDKYSEEEANHLSELYFKFKQIEGIIDRKKYKKKNFSNNLVSKRIVQDRETVEPENDELSNSELYKRITGGKIDEE